MRSLTQKFSTLALFLVVFGASTALAQTNDDQVPFTFTGTGVLTGVTKLPGGLTQFNFDGLGHATHLGDTTGSVTRIQDNHGNFGTAAVIISAIGTFTVTGGTGAFANATDD